MEKKNYSDKLKNPKWQKKRLQILQRDNFQCMCCFDTNKELNVHHFNYLKNPWDSEDYELVTLCKDCHKTYHIVFDNFDKAHIANLSALYWNYFKEWTKRRKEHERRLDKTTQEIT